MTEEQAVIRVTTEMNAEMQKELNFKQFIFSLVLMIIGGAGVLVMLVLDIVATVRDESDALIFGVLIVFAVFLGAGIGLMILIRKTNKTVTATVKTNSYEFFPSYFTVTEICNGEEVAHAKVYNDKIVKSRETKNYLFFYANAAAAYPVKKQSLTEEELAKLKEIFRLTQKRAANR